MPGPVITALKQLIQAAWFEKNLAVLLYLLIPLSWLFGFLTRMRRTAFRMGVFTRHRLDVPVIVIGNLVVGGAGKTPLALWMVDQLRAVGRRPGIISRGYLGSAHAATEVRPESDPAQVGDEPVLLARRSAVPVFVARQRVAAGRALLEAHPEVDVLVCDDGLQHYALARDVELAVVDARGAGNGFVLPAGPLRESWQRLAGVDGVVRNLGGAGAGPVDMDLPVGVPCFSMRLVSDRFYSLTDPGRYCAASDLVGRRLIALAGLAVPERFFATLRAHGLEVTECVFPDHHAYIREDFVFPADAVLLMTEKDAVKCAPLFAGDAQEFNETWVLPVSATVTPELISLVLEKIDGCKTA